MLIIPQTFFADHRVKLHEQAIVHGFIDGALVQREQQPGPMLWAEFLQAGFTAKRSFGLGQDADRDHVAVEMIAPSDQPIDGFKHNGLRAWFDVLDDATLGIALRAVQVLDWDRTHQFCGACGQPTVFEVSEHERARSCKPCRLTFYPRISPAMMVLITRGRELLLGRGVNFPPGRYSALAGFLEAGETIEQAIHREVMEEVNVRVDNLRYFASQSWPFPNSLMIAFTANYLDGELKYDPHELADAQWFDIDNLPSLPPRLSVAGALLTDTIKQIRESQS